MKKYFIILLIAAAGCKGKQGLNDSEIKAAKYEEELQNIKQSYEHRQHQDSFYHVLSVLMKKAGCSQDSITHEIRKNIIEDSLYWISKGKPFMVQ
jgi:hypothetical protein